MNNEQKLLEKVLSKHNIILGYDVYTNLNMLAIFLLGIIFGIIMGLALMGAF